MTNPFGTLSSGGAFFAPKDIHGHVVIIANVKPLVNKYDELAKANRDFATFDYADLTAGVAWQTGVTDNHVGIVNRLKDVAGVHGAPPMLARVDKAMSKNGLEFFLLTDLSQDGEAVAKAVAFLASAPVPTASPFAAPAPVVAAAPAPAPVPVAVPAQGPAAQPQQDVAALLAQLQAQQQLQG